MAPEPKWCRGCPSAPCTSKCTTQLGFLAAAICYLLLICLILSSSDLRSAVSECSTILHGHPLCLPLLNDTRLLQNTPLDTSDWSAFSLCMLEMLDSWDLFVPSQPPSNFYNFALSIELIHVLLLTCFMEQTLLSH